jgi:hypothetical protein
MRVLEKLAKEVEVAHKDCEPDADYVIAAFEHEMQNYFTTRAFEPMPKMKSNDYKEDSWREELEDTWHCIESSGEYADGLKCKRWTIICDGSLNDKEIDQVNWGMQAIRLVNVGSLTPYIFLVKKSTFDSNMFYFTFEASKEALPIVCDTLLSAALSYLKRYLGLKDYLMFKNEEHIPSWFNKYMRLGKE